MARISTYQTDNIINDNDRLIGTDGGQIGPGGEVIAGTAGKTRNFSIGDLRRYFTARSEEGTETLNTILHTSDPDSTLELFSAHVVYTPGMETMLTLPTLNPTVTGAVQDGSWIRITNVANSGMRIFAGGTSQTYVGDRFMAGLNPDGRSVDRPWELIIPGGEARSFELIYIADNIVTDGVAAPVGWIIVN